MLTLWDLIEPVIRPAARRPRAAAPTRQPVSRPAPSPAREPAPIVHTVSPAPARESMQDRYDRITQDMLRAHDIRVRRWRTSMSGIAWYVTYRDGRISRLIEAPRPRGPMSAAVFLHEVGHHAIGFDVYKPRCLEEYHAWAWALRAMERHGLNITDSVRHRMQMSLWYAVSKARRRGIKAIPPELEPYIQRPPRRRHTPA